MLRDEDQLVTLRGENEELQRQIDELRQQAQQQHNRQLSISSSSHHHRNHDNSSSSGIMILSLTSPIVALQFIVLQ